MISHESVSVYMTVKNGLKHLAASIDSIKAQSFASWEAVIVDDGSVDGTAEWLNTLALADQRFKVIITDGVGRASALNIALASCKAEFVANLDADDLWHPRHLDVLYNTAVTQGIDFICSKSITFSDGYPWCKSKSYLIDRESISIRSCNTSFLVHNPVCHSGVLIRNDLMREVKFYEASRRSQIDLELWYRLLVRGITIYQTNVPLVAKRLHSGQLFENKRRLRYIWNYYVLKNRFLKDTKAPYRFRFLALIYLVAGLLPEFVRNKIR